MNETRTTGLAGRHPIATSLFGGAMLAAVATAALAQGRPLRLVSARRPCVSVSSFAPLR
jgi:hypothetical protein